MTDVPDDRLLEQFARNGSEEAFAALVQRHIALVHSVALRHTANPQHAEDITQAVFVILARKAGALGRKTVLPGWLYHTARLTAANLQRAEARRVRREQEAFMQSRLEEIPTDNLWRELSPQLDEAMAGLGASERDALVLRYFQNKSMAEVGQLLGLAENTAQKRVSRALEKLREFFTKRGVDSTAAGIAENISAHSVQAVPVALAKTISAVAITKGATASASTLTLIKGALKIMAWTKMKTAIVAGVAVILTTGTSIMVIKEVHKPKAIHLTTGGLPQTLEELNTWYVEPPAGQNAATFELQGIKAMQTSGADQSANLPILGKLPPPPPGTPLPSPVKSALAAFVQRNREALQFFAQGAQYEQSRYPIDLNQGAETLLLPHLQGIKRGMQMVEMAAILDAENNDEKQAADDVLMTLALAHSLKAEPVTISQLVRAAGVSLSVAALEQVVNRTTLRSESLTELAKAFQNMEEYDARGEGFNRGVTGELVSHMALLKNRDKLVQVLTTPAIMDMPDEQRRRMVQYVNQSGSLKAEQDYFEATFQQFLAARQKAFPSRLKTADWMQQRAAKATAGGLLINGLFGGDAGFVNREASCLANLRLALTAVALEQFRAAHGNRYPATLSELTPTYLPTISTDPFDGRSLRYRQQGAGYVLYSIGPNLKDDGGQRMTGQVGDLVFAVVTPPSS